MRPMGIVTAPDGRSVYVTTGRSSLVLIIETGTNAVTSSIEAGPRRWGVALSPDVRTLYTANGPSNDISIIDLDTKHLSARVGVGQRPRGVIFVARP